MENMTHNQDQPDTTPASGRKPLDAFMYHQRRAVSETGRALLSLLPKEFRTHAESAVDETRASWEALFDGVIDTVQGGLDKLRSAPPEDTGKVKVEVE